MTAGLGDHIGICLDVSHTLSSGLDPAEEARFAGYRLVAPHRHDCDGSGLDLVPGPGKMDWPAFQQALEAIGFQGIRVFEISPVPEGLERTLARLAELARRRVWNFRQATP